MTIKTETRVYALIVLLALTGLVWGTGKSAAIREERSRREEVVESLEKEIEATRFHARLATAYAVELYATMRAAGLNPPSPPKELRDDPPRSVESDP